MQPSNEILNELEQLSMVVAGISRQMPYEAPEGYFSEFPGKILTLLEQDVLEKAPSPDWGKGPSMSVPEGYFEGFASRMMDKIRAREAQAGAPMVRPAAEAEEHSAILSRIGKNMPYQVPEGYFDTSIPSATLLALKDKTVYEVPDGYFETLAEIVVARIQPARTQQAPEVKRTPGKLISIGSTRKTAWWKYAAAAVVTGFILTFGWSRLRTNPGGPTTVASMNVPQDLTKVSDQDLESYVNDHAGQIQQVQVEEDYANSTASLDISDNDVKSLLGDVPDGDLAQYMEEHGDLHDYPTN